MGSLRVKNWGRYQHYKQRNPPWIKLHRSLLLDPGFHKLDDKEKAFLVLSWVLASQCDGVITDDVKALSSLLGMHECVDLKRLIELGWYEPCENASTELATRLQRAIPET